MKIEIKPSSTPRPKPFKDLSGPLGFGQYFSDHMFTVSYAAGRGWHSAQIIPYGPLALDPAASVLHYGQAMFEGMKAFHQQGGGSALFRPEFNWQRMKTGSERLCMPMIDQGLFLEGLTELVRLDESWVPRQKGASLYLRPTLIGTEGFLGVRPSNEYLFFVITSPVSAYYQEGHKAVKIWIEENDSRAAPGGLGATKAAANYAASLKAALAAKEKGYAQVLWLDTTKKFVEEVGTMNVFFVIGKKVITPKLSGTILAGGTREACLFLLRRQGLQVEERAVTLSEVLEAQKNTQLSECFGTGTAAVITPVSELSYRGQALKIGDSSADVGPVASRLYDDISAIQYGVAADPDSWLRKI